MVGLVKSIMLGRILQEHIFQLEGQNMFRDFGESVTEIGNMYVRIQEENEKYKYFKYVNVCSLPFYSYLCYYS